MQIEIKTKKENPLLKRQELEGIIAFEGATPSLQNLKDELAKKLGVQTEVVAVRHIFGDFGGVKADFDAVVYPTKEQFDKIEPKKKEKKLAPGAAPAAPAAPAAK